MGTLGTFRIQVTGTSDDPLWVAEELRRLIAHDPQLKDTTIKVGEPERTGFITQVVTKAG